MRLMSRIALLAGIAGALVILPGGASGQTVEGRLTDATSGEPLANGTLRLLSRNGSIEAVLQTVRTDSTGAFALTARAPGTYRVSAERRGYLSAISSPVDLDRGDTIDAEFKLSQTRVVLEPLVVLGEPSDVRPLVKDFYDRAQAHMVGEFVTRKDIQQLKPNRTTELLRRFPGIQLSEGRGGGYNVLVRGNCTPTFYVDGTRVHLNGLTIDDMVDPSELEGIEIYRSVAEAPVQYQGVNAGCSAILLWTRSGA